MKAEVKLFLNKLTYAEICELELRLLDGLAYILPKKTEAYLREQAKKPKAHKTVPKVRKSRFRWN